MGQRLALQREGRRVARAPQPTLGRIQPELAALMGADAGDRLQSGVGTVDEPTDRAEVEREGSALRDVGAGAHRPPGTRIGFKYSLGGRRGLGRTRIRVGVSRLRPTTIPVAADAAARPVPMTTCRRVPDGPHDVRPSTCGVSPIDAASRRCRSVTNSSRGESLPVRAARNSMAVFISCASKSSGRARCGALAAQQVVDEAAHCSSAHIVSSSLVCAAMRKARYCNTLAFATLTPM